MAFAKHRCELTSCQHVNHTFEEHYCTVVGCPPEAFVNHLFWRCLPWPARLLAPLVGRAAPNYFALDRELIAEVGRSRTLSEIERELRDFVNDERNHSWLRRSGRVRVSTRRLRRVVRRCLGENRGAKTARLAHL